MTTRQQIEAAGSLHSVWHEPESLDLNPMYYSTKHLSKLHDSEVFCSRYDYEGAFLANSYVDGSLMIVNPALNEKLYFFKTEKMKFPITRLAWQHVYQYNIDIRENVLFGCDCEGNLLHWSTISGTKIDHTKVSEENKYNTVDCAGDGRHVALAGTLPQVEIWDVNTMQMTQCWNKEEHGGHENAIFSARFYPFNSFNLYSGGWDRTIRLWDVRHGHTVGVMLGTQIIGDSLDMASDGHTLVSGGGTGGEGLMIWDIRKTEGPVMSIPFSPGEVRNPKVEPIINSVRFIPRTRQIIAAASDADYPAKIFNFQTGELIEKFYNKCPRATACDVVHKDGMSFCIGDAAGVTQIVTRDAVRKV